MFAEIQGVVEACVRLSGMPDLTLSFMVSFLSALRCSVSVLVLCLSSFPNVKCILVKESPSSGRREFPPVRAV